MSDALFLAEFDDAAVGQVVEVTGDEARHAVAVRRIRTGERVLVANGRGMAVRGTVVEAQKNRLAVETEEVLASPPRLHRFLVVQALAKGDRSERAVEIMTELGVDEIIAWQASRSIVRWHGERGEKSLAKWAATAREATKQSRRFRVPEVTFATTSQVIERIGSVASALVLHEDASGPVTPAAIPKAGEVLCIVGPEGGISPEELEEFEATGAIPVLVSDGVLRTSTAGAAALAQLQLLTASLG